MAALLTADCLAPDTFTRLFAAALSVLEEVARTSPNPAERRRAATAILRYLFARSPKADRPTPTTPTSQSNAPPTKLNRPDHPHATRSAHAATATSPPSKPTPHLQPEPERAALAPPLTQPRTTTPPTTPPISPPTSLLTRAPSTPLSPAVTLLANFAASHSLPPPPSLPLWPFAIWPFAPPAIRRPPVRTHPS